MSVRTEPRLQHDDMPTLHPHVTTGRQLVRLGGVFLLSAVGCGREPTGSAGANTGVVRFSQGLSWLAQFPSGTQQFQAAGGTGVNFTKVRVVLNNPDGSVALDTVINFPPGATELQVTLSVPLPASAPASGQPLALNLDYQNAAGQTVFHGGPVTVTAVPTAPGAGPPPPSQVTIPITYTGPGANAASVRISPRSLTVNGGGTFTFSAQALDASGNVLPNTPVLFSSQNTSLATINAASGAGAAGQARGAVIIEAKLLTGPSDEATLTVRPIATAIALVSGAAQTANVNATLANPVVVRVTAADGNGVDGVPVAFSASGGGTVGTASATTDANGLASTTWKLGGTAGTQTLTASGAGLSGSPLSVTATARALDPVRLVVATQPPAFAQAGSAFGLIVNAVDATGAVAAAFTGPITVSLAEGAPAGSFLAGTATLNAVAGIATFTDLRINLVGTYALNVRTPSLTGTSSSSFNVVPGAARRMVFQNYPIAGSVAGSMLDPVSVEVRDSLNNVVTSYSGPVTVGIADAGAALSATRRGRSSLLTAVPMTPPLPTASASALTTVNAVAGLATFTGLQFNVAGTYRLTASAPGLTTANGPAFPVVPGPAAALVRLSGGGDISADATTTVIVQVTDQFGNPTGGGRTVIFTPAAGSGSASPTSTVANAGGSAQTAWTVSGAAGTQTLSASSTGLSSVVVTANVSIPAGGGASAGTFIVIHDVNWGDNSNGIPYAGNVQFMKNLVNFSIAGARSAATKVMLFDFGTLSYYNFAGNWSGMASVMQSQGATPYMSTSRADLVTVPTDVKIVILHLPAGTFTTSEVNGLKSFLAQGGRVLYIGENSGFQYTLTAANILLSTMGASTTVTGYCATGAVTSYPNPLTAGIPASGPGAFNIACASIITPGAGDIVLMRDASNNAIMVIAHVNTTPIAAASLVGPSAQVKTASTLADPVPRPSPESTLKPPPKRP